MDLLTWRAALKLAIAKHNRADINRLIRSDPKQRYQRNFNILMVDVAAEDIEVAFLKPLTVFLSKIEFGKILDEEALFKMLYGIQRRIAWNLIAKTSRRNNPLMFPRRQGESQNRRRLFCPEEIQLDQQPNSGLTTVEQLEEREELQRLTRELESMPQLFVEVLREVRRFELAHGSSYKAFRAVALLAQLDDNGHVTSIRTPDPEAPIRHQPAKSVVRQIHKIYQKALDYLG